MKSWKHIFLVTLVVMTVVSLLLSACGPLDISNGNSNKEKIKEKDKDKDKDDGNSPDDGNISGGKITICHRTGSAKNPYVEITISEDATTDGHGTHAGDLIPAPEGGCPASVNTSEDHAGNSQKITICHRTGSTRKPYVEITISANATTDGHGTHEEDLIPAPEGGCPDTVLNKDGPAK